MRQKRLHSLGWYVALSSLLHLLFVGWFVRHLTLSSQGARPQAPVRVTIAAPTLPSGSAPSVRDKTPALSPARPLPGMPAANPLASTPLVTAAAITPLAPLSASLPPPPDRQIDLRRPMATVSVPARVPELSASATLQHTPTPAPAMPQRAPAQAPIPALLVAKVPEPAPPAASVLVATPPPPALETQPTRERVIPPAPQVTQSQAAPRLVAQVRPIEPTPQSPPDPPTVAAAASTSAIPAVSTPMASAPVVTTPPVPPLAPGRKTTQEHLQPPTPQVAPRVAPPRVVAKVSPSMPHATPTTETNISATALMPAASALIQSDPPPPPAPATRRQPANVARTIPPPPPAGALPLLPSTPPPRILSAREPTPTTSAILSTPTAVQAAQPLPTPSTVAGLPAGRAPRRPDRDNRSQEVVTTPRLAQPNPGHALPSRARPSKLSSLAPRQAIFESPPRFVYQPKPAYPRRARKRGWEGKVLLDIELLADGTVGDIKIAKSSGYALLDTAAQQAVKKWRHVPVQRNGVAVTRRARLPILFRLD